MADPDRLLFWTDRGVILRGGRRIGEHTFDTPPVSAVIFTWDELQDVRPIDPWPRVRITGQSGGGTPPSSYEVVIGNEGAEPEEFAERVFAFLAEIQRRRRGVVSRGWANRQDVQWDRVAAMPGREVASGGAYRSTGDLRVLVSRMPTGWLGRARVPAALSFGTFGLVGANVAADALSLGLVALVGAMATTAVLATGAGAFLMGRLVIRLPYYLRDGEIAVTDEHVFVRHGLGAVYRVPRFELAARVPHAQPGVTHYVFGRRAILALTDVPECPVASLLEEQLQGARRAQVAVAYSR